MNQFTVTAPVAKFTGESCGVAFKGGTGTVSDASKEGRSAIEYFRRRGYTLTPVETEPEPEQEPDTTPDPDHGPNLPPFNPSEYNADEVIAYLDSLDIEDAASQAEHERVIAAEQDGKNRKTITEKGTSA
ncbi:hypothetical protein [Streptomyces pacificus]|uniref:Uncharacterized protein n=1 Tax=Streptomyces pacificus TaxID=2705029 RepID=A0A6A0AVB2_9ACTN|nr:hypothetical protein [Streptomyces pacificus]GFH36628.1 hypothetical protein SCWH03_28590 [Streptomyces pacificus]